MRHWRLILFVALIVFALVVPWIPFALAEGSGPNETATIKDWLLLFFGFDWLNVIIVAIAGYALILLVYWQMKRGDGFDLRMLFADCNDGAWIVRPGKVYQFGAFAATSWAFVWLVTHEKLTEFYLIAYAALWAASPVMNRWAVAKFPVAGEEPPPPAAPPTEGKP